MNVVKFNPLGFLKMSTSNADIAQVVSKRIADFCVEKCQQALIGVDQLYFCAQPAEYGGVLAADDPRPDDRHFSRRMI